MRILAILSLVLFSCSGTATKSPKGLAPEEALKSFQLPEGFQIELVAAEPMISDPVAMEVDELGNIYVVEMHGYPLDTKGSGVIKLLTDTDGDGFPDKSTVFADSLVLPNGIQRWKNGVIVTDMPDVLYFEDTNGDNVADRKEVLLTGFARSNPQHNGNTPLLGPDNWIYVAHEGEVGTKFFTEQFGDTGRAITFPGRPGSPVLPRNANGRSIRFKPDTYQLEMLSGDSQYGHTFSPYGEHINTSNANHLFHEVLAARYLERNPAVEIGDVSEDISDHGNASQVFPVTKNPEHQLLTDVGVITSSCGVTWYGGGLFPAQFDNVTFIAEPVHNLVHADVLKRKGASFVASRLHQTHEFVANTDAWSRPVAFYNGPDGALYVIDYYRQIIEHPEWMSEEVNKSGALYNGFDMGRIYRITPVGSPKLSWCNKINLTSAPVSELVEHLGNPVAWWRKTAQRLLLDRKPSDLHVLVQEFLQQQRSPVAWVHALWTLEGTGNLNQELILAALKHPEPGVRINGIRLAELHLDEMPALVSSLTSLQSDADAAVRYQLLCTLGFVDTNAALTARMNILGKDIDDRWVSAAALTSVPGNELNLIQKSISLLGKESTPGKVRFFEHAAAIIARSGNPASVDRLITLTLGNVKSPESAWWKAALLNGLSMGMRGANVKISRTRESQLLAMFSEKTPAGLRTGALRVVKEAASFDPEYDKQWSPKAMVIALDRTKPASFREDAIRLLEMFPTTGNADVAVTLLAVDEPESVQRLAISLLRSVSQTKSTEYLTKRWNEFTPALRQEILRGVLRDTSSIGVFLSRVEDKSILPSTISWPQTVNLMNHADDRVRSRSRKLLAVESLSENELLQKYGAALDGKGDFDAGAAVFRKNCSTCHQIDGKDGVAYGPDLASIRNRDSRFILLDIVNPNRSIADGYELWTLATKSGNELSGIIASQTSSSLTMRFADGTEQIIQRGDIKSLSAVSTSAMPQSIGSSMTEAELRDLVAFIKANQI